MTNAMSAAEERSLRAQLTALERKQDARFARRETLLRERDRALAGQESELEATLKDYREQLAAAQAELAELDKEPDEPPARLPVPGQKQLGPEGDMFTSPEEAIAAAGPWSPEFQAWRKAHIPTSQGIIQ